MRKVYLVLFVVIANACGIAGESLAKVCPKDVDVNCAVWDKVRGICKSDKPELVEFREKYCQETCQLCKPPAKEECYFSSGEKSKYGCCWDGRTPARGPNNQGCPVCENFKGGSYCHMYNRFCFDTDYAMRLRDECPMTCGYCKKALSPCYDESGKEIICEGRCYDIAPEALCKKREKDGYCSQADWKDFLKTNCARTCHFCGSPPPPTVALIKTPEAACSDKYGQNICELHKEKGRCSIRKAWKTFMKKNCAKTCGFCD